MPTETGALEWKDNKPISTGQERWSLKVNGEYHGLRKPQDIEAKTTSAIAWRLCEKAIKGQTVEIEYSLNGRWRNIEELKLLGDAAKEEVYGQPGAPKDAAPPKTESDKDAYWDHRNQWIAWESLISSASKIVVAQIEAGDEEAKKAPGLAAAKIAEGWIKRFPQAFRETE